MNMVRSVALCSSVSALAQARSAGTTSLARGRALGHKGFPQQSKAREERPMLQTLRGCIFAWIGAAALAASALALGLVPASAADPLRIGFGMALTGPLAPNGKSALLAMKIWEEDINAKGGLLGRPVQLVYYDDQSNPSTVPGIYTKILDIDQVDLIVGGYATNMLAPAMPIAMRKKKVLIGILGVAVNSDFKYPGYFAMIPSGQNPKPAFTAGFFDVAMLQNPKPKTIALVGADMEFSQNALEGARMNAKA